ncbi:Small glutamine-rich tetratricopeptide repeat-containing protein [Entamoeba marina]
MEVPTQDQAFFKDLTEDVKNKKLDMAKTYFGEHYPKLERFPAVVIPSTKEQVTPELLEQAEIHKTKGNDLFKSKDYSTAVCEYSRAIECNPFNHIYYSNRAACYSYLENYELARRDGEKCTTLCPTFAKGFGRLAVAYQHLNRLDEAKVAIDKGLELDPQNQTLLTTKMDILDEISEKDASKLKKPEQSQPPPQPQQQPQPQPQQQQQSQQQNAGQQQGGFANILGNLMNNPAIAQMAQGMMNNPAMMNMAQNMMNNPAMMNMAQNMMGSMGEDGLANLMNMAGQGGNPENPPNPEGNTQTDKDQQK